LAVRHMTRTGQFGHPRSTEAPRKIRARIRPVTVKDSPDHLEVAGGHVALTGGAPSGGERDVVLGAGPIHGWCSGVATHLREGLPHTYRVEQPNEWGRLRPRCASVAAA